MKTETKLTGFARYAWLTLVFNLLVILWGVFLRASLSGDGCGAHWLTCGGEVIPTAPQLKTSIEFFHRVTSALAGLTVIGLVVWALINRRREKSAHSSLVLKMAVASLVFIILEGVVGGLLVLTGNTAANWTPTRPLWMAAHLVNTFTLIAVLTLTAWFAGGGRAFNFKVARKYLILLALGAAGIFLVGMSGSIAALSSMIFPSSTLSEGLARDFSATSHYILKLRVFHPLIAIAVGTYLVFIAVWLKFQARANASVGRWSNILSILLLIQFAVGMTTIALLAPIVLQIAHLFLADAIWISFVLMTAAFLAERGEIEGPA